MWRTSFGGVNDFGLGSAIAVFLFLLVIPVLAAQRPALQEGSLMRETHAHDSEPERGAKPEKAQPRAKQAQPQPKPGGDLRAVPAPVPPVVVPPAPAGAERSPSAAAERRAGARRAPARPRPGAFCA